MDYLEDYEDGSLTGDEALDYLVYDEIVNGDEGNGCLTVILFIFILGGFCL
jgi:hypothetical protein